MVSLASMKPWASLIATNNSRVYRIGQQRTRIGSALTADLRIVDSSIARMQAEIYWITTTTTTTRPNTNKNIPVLHVFTLQPPTYVNKKLITKSTVLHADDLITFGICRQHTFVFHIEEEGDATVATAAPSVNEFNTLIGPKTALGASTRHLAKRNLKQEFNSIAATELLDSTTHTPSQAKPKPMIKLDSNLTPKFSPSIRNYFLQINTKSLQILDEIERKYLFKESTSQQSMIINDTISSPVYQHKVVLQQEISGSLSEPIASTPDNSNFSAQSMIDPDLDSKPVLTREDDNSKGLKQEASSRVVACQVEVCASPEVNAIRDLCQRRDSKRVEINERYNSATLTHLRCLFVNLSPKADYDTHVNAVSNLFGERTPQKDESQQSHVASTSPTSATALITELFRETDTPTAPEANCDRYENVVQLQVKNGNLFDRIDDAITYDKSPDHRMPLSGSPTSPSKSLSFEITNLSKSFAISSTLVQISDQYFEPSVSSQPSSSSSVIETRLSLLTKVPEEYISRSELNELNNLLKCSQQKLLQKNVSPSIASSLTHSSVEILNAEISSLCIRSRVSNATFPRELGDQHSFSHSSLPGVSLSESSAKSFYETEVGSIASSECSVSVGQHLSPSMLSDASLSESSENSIKNTPLSLQISKSHESKLFQNKIWIASSSFESSYHETSASLSGSIVDSATKTKSISIKIPSATLALVSSEQLSPAVLPGTTMDYDDSFKNDQLSLLINKLQNSMASPQHELVVYQSPEHALAEESSESSVKSSNSVNKPKSYSIQIATPLSSLDFSVQSSPGPSLPGNRSKKTILSPKMNKSRSLKSLPIKVMVASPSLESSGVKTSPSTTLPGVSMSESTAKSPVEVNFAPIKVSTVSSALKSSDKQELVSSNVSINPNESALIKSRDSIASASNELTNQQLSRDTFPFQSEDKYLDKTKLLLQYIESRLSIAPSSVRIDKQQLSSPSLSSSPLSKSCASIVKTVKSIAKRYNLRTRGTSSESKVTSSVESSFKRKKAKVKKQRKQVTKKQKEAKVVVPKEKKQTKQVARCRVFFSDMVKVHLLKCSPEDHFEPLSVASVKSKKFHSKRKSQRCNSKNTARAIEQFGLNDEL